MLPRENELPNRTYKAKKIMRSMSIDYEKIHTCPNDYILYLNEYAHLEKCPVYRRSPYHTNKSPVKVLRYFPIIPRLNTCF